MEHLSEDQLKAFDKLITSINLPVPRTVTSDLRMSVYTDDGSLTEQLEASTVGFFMKATILMGRLMNDIQLYRKETATKAPENEELVALKEKVESLDICFKGVVTNYHKLEERLNELERKANTSL